MSCGLKYISYHCPLLLKNDMVNQGSKPFRVLDCQFEDKKFSKFVEEAWNGQHVYGWGSFVLKEKIKALKLEWKVWNNDVAPCRACRP